jgi:hypothetical protein
MLLLTGRDSQNKWHYSSVYVNIQTFRYQRRGQNSMNCKVATIMTRISCFYILRECNSNRLLSHFPTCTDWHTYHRFVQRATRSDKSGLRQCCYLWCKELRPGPTLSCDLSNANRTLCLQESQDLRQVLGASRYPDTLQQFCPDKWTLSSSPQPGLASHRTARCDGTFFALTSISGTWNWTAERFVGWACPFPIHFSPRGRKTQAVCHVTVHEWG